MESLPQLIINSAGLNLSSEWYSEYNSMSFLQMLQGGDTVMPETNMELLLRLQQQRWARTAEQVQHHSCVTRKSVAATRERKKRKRTRPPPATTKKAEEVESQRLTHIAVERNRRRLMNEHLAALRDLMPPSFVRRGDQASIVGGAIEFVKELEQHLASLQAEKRMRTATAFTTTSPSNEEDAGHSAAPADDYLFDTPQQMSYSRSQQQRRNEEGVDVEATVVQAHASVRVTAPQRAGQLVRAVAAVEELRLSVQHLNITALDEESIHYSLNLKMEDDCQLFSADEIATAVHQIFTYINGC